MDPATLVRHALAMPKKPLTLKEALSSVADFRIDRRRKYPLYEILMVAVCAMIGAAESPFRTPSSPRRGDSPGSRPPSLRGTRGHCRARRCSSRRP